MPHFRCSSIRRLLVILAFCFFWGDVFAACVSVATVSGSSDPGNHNDPQVQVAMRGIITSSVQFTRDDTIAISNTSTGRYAIYWYSQTGFVVTATGSTPTGYPPDSSGCPVTNGNPPSGAGGGGSLGGGGGGGSPAPGCYGDCGTVTVGDPNPTDP